MKTKLFVSLFLLLSVYVFADYRADVQTPNGSNVVAYVTTESTAATRVYFDSHFANAYPNAQQIDTYAGYSSSRTFNCHGYAWYMSEFQVPLSHPRWIGYSAGNIDEHVYWSDGSYVEVPQPVYPGKVSWASGDHSAVTTKTNGLYISKWNEYPLMRHQQGDSPYGSTNLKYYKKAGWPINDDYAQATTLTPNATSLVSGTTALATMSVESVPSCGSGIDDDVWYKFTASNNVHSVNVSDIKYDAYGATSLSLALYDSNLNLIECMAHENVIVSNTLNVGQVYYVRVWTSQEGRIKTASFKVGVKTPSGNVVKSLNMSWNAQQNGYTITAQFIHSASIPLNDIAFEWQLSAEPTFPYSPYAFDLSNSQTFSVVLYSYETDWYTNVNVRMKQISTNSYISDWYKTPSPIFSWE